MFVWAEVVSGAGPVPYASVGINGVVQEIHRKSGAEHSSVVILFSLLGNGNRASQHVEVNNAWILRRFHIFHRRSVVGMG